MNLQRAAAARPGRRARRARRGRARQRRVLRARTVVLVHRCPLAHMNVPGEEEYRNKGVTFCPHCDGPLFKGKRVAVIGGGNSASRPPSTSPASSPTSPLLEFDRRAAGRRGAAAQAHSLPNVDVILSAKTTEVLGDGEQVTGWTTRTAPPASRGTVDLDGDLRADRPAAQHRVAGRCGRALPAREIVIDDRGQTSLPGVFAAGDCTTVPYKQIVIASAPGRPPRSAPSTTSSAPAPPEARPRRRLMAGGDRGRGRGILRGAEAAMNLRDLRNTSSPSPTTGTSDGRRGVLRQPADALDPAEEARAVELGVELVERPPPGHAHRGR
jgi:hypothetical protein